MDKKNKEKKEIDLQFDALISLVYIGIIFIIYPLYSKGNYFGITETKTRMLYLVSGIFILLWIISRITDGFVFSKTRYNKLLMIYGISILVSGLFSKYKDIVWLGMKYRFTGTVFMIVLILVMLAIAGSLNEKYIVWAIYMFIISGMILSIWAVLNFIGFDPFYMHDGISEIQYRKFVSGIGNITFFGSFFCMSTPMAVATYAREKNLKIKLALAIGVIVNVLAVYISGSDGAFMGTFAVLFAVLPIYITNREDVIGFLESVVLCSVTGIVAIWLKQYSIYEEEAFDSIMMLFIKYKLFLVMLIVSLIGLIAVRLIKKLEKFGIIKIIYYCFGVVAVFVVVCKTNLMHFDLNFGNGRGYAWYNSVRIFLDEPWYRKLIGNGADTFANLLIEYTGSNIGVNGQSFDNPHCEYLQYVLSFGIIGLVIYLCILGKLIIDISKCKQGQNGVKIAIIMAIMGYMLQAVVGVNQVFTTPLFFIICAIGIAYVRINYKEKTML